MTSDLCKSLICIVEQHVTKQLPAGAGYVTGAGCLADSPALVRFAALLIGPGVISIVRLTHVVPL